MPWESGPRGRPYYTRTRRENGRVIREYIGVGQEGQRAAEEDEALRAGRAFFRARVGEDERAALAHRAGEEGVAFGDAPVEALGGQNGQLRLRHVEPAAMLGRIVPFETLDQAARLGGWKRFVE